MTIWDIRVVVFVAAGSVFERKADNCGNIRQFITSLRGTILAVLDALDDVPNRIEIRSDVDAVPSASRNGITIYFPILCHHLVFLSFHLFQSRSALPNIPVLVQASLQYQDGRESPPAEMLLRQRKCFIMPQSLQQLIHISPTVPMGKERQRIPSRSPLCPDSWHRLQDR